MAVAPPPTLGRCLVAEGLGTALLLATIVGSGIMADRLSGGSEALALLPHALATGAVLAALILTFGAVSGAHFNPAVTLADATQGGVTWRTAGLYIAAQLAGGLLGVIAAHVMFDEPWIAVSTRARSGAGLVVGELIATFGLVAVIWGCARRRSEAVPFAVGLYIVGAIWFTSSTAFANPAVSVARMFSDTWTGIRPMDAPWFVIAQIAGALAATAVFRWLTPPLPVTAADVVVPHPREEAR